MLEHVDKLLEIPGARLEFGGKPLELHSIPECYGAMEPTAVFVPLKEILKSADVFALATTEIFGPFQVRTQAVMCVKVYRMKLSHRMNKSHTFL